MAGNLSIESCGNIFPNESRQASVNYGIDSNTISKPDIIYAVKTSSNDQLLEVKNTEDYAGIENNVAIGVIIKLSDWAEIYSTVSDNTTSGGESYAGVIRKPVDKFMACLE